MSAIEPLYSLMGINTSKLTKEEKHLLEAELFIRVCEELKDYLRMAYREYFRLMKFTVEQENAMLDANFLNFIIRDILTSKEYSIEGIAYYANTHEDVIHDVTSGQNTNPSAILLRRIIQLHRSIRRELYL